MNFFVVNKTEHSNARASFIEHALQSAHVMSFSLTSD